MFRSQPESYQAEIEARKAQIEARKAEAARKAEEARLAEEEARLAEEARKAEEGARMAEEGARKAQRKSDDFSPRLITILDPTNPASEAYRTLRTNLFYALVDTPPKVIVVTSPGPQEGKSTTCANLAVVLAQADKSILVVDCDLRKPVLHKIFELRNFRGLTNVLTGEHTLQEVCEESIAGLTFITVGPIPPNPAELLGSARFTEFLEQAREEFDYVLLDAPPTVAVADPAILATQGDGVLLVLDAQNTRKAYVRQAVRNLETVGAKVLGTVMNNTKAAKGEYYYGYTYGDGTSG